jgi:hypothetical protein
MPHTIHIGLSRSRCRGRSGRRMRRKFPILPECESRGKCDLSCRECSAVQCSAVQCSAGSGTPGGKEPVTAVILGRNGEEGMDMRSVIHSAVQCSAVQCSGLVAADGCSHTCKSMFSSALSLVSAQYNQGASFLTQYIMSYYVTRSSNF